MIENYESIDGMFGFEEIYSEVISGIYKGERMRIAEVGAWLGRSSFYLVEKNHDKADIFIVDRWQGTLGGGVRPNSDQMPQFLENMKKWEGKYTAIRSDSAEGAKHFEDATLDFVFIDADHEYNAVKKDILAWLPKVKRGGIIAGHDYNIYQGVNDAVKEIFGDDIKVYNNCYAWIKQL